MGNRGQHGGDLHFRTLSGLEHPGAPLPKVRSLVGLEKLWWCPHWKSLNGSPHDGKPCTDAYYYRGQEVDEILRDLLPREAPIKVDQLNALLDEIEAEGWASENFNDSLERLRRILSKRVKL